MANRVGPAGWLSAEPTTDDGHVAYRLNVNVIANPASSNVAITAPLGTQAIASSVAVNPATSSTWAITAAQLPSTLGQKTAANSVSVAWASDATLPAGTNTLGTVLAIGNVANDAVDSGAPVKIGGVANDTPPTAVQAGDRVNARYSLAGAAYTTLVTQAGSTIGTYPSLADGVASPVTASQGLSSVSFNLRWNGASWDKSAKANATSRIISSAASTNATSAKASAGTVFMVTGRNANAAVLYLKLYNKASAPTVGTDTPVQTFALPPQANFALDWAEGRYFGTGIAFALTTGGADADTGAVAAGDILGLNIDYS